MQGVHKHLRPAPTCVDRLADFFVTTCPFKPRAILAMSQQYCLINGAMHRIDIVGLQAAMSSCLIMSISFAEELGAKALARFVQWKQWTRSEWHGNSG